LEPGGGRSELGGPLHLGREGLKETEESPPWRPGQAGSAGLGWGE